MTASDGAELEALEQAAFSAWPAERVVSIEGWKLRSMHGVTRRANSVFTVGEVSDVEQAIARVEATYTSLGQRSYFQLSPLSQPRDLDALLQARGYVVDAPVSIQTNELSAILGSGIDAKAAAATLSDQASDDWLELAVHRGRFAASAPVFRALLARLGARASFALARHDGCPIASALCVRDGGWLGIFSMAVLPEARRRGAGSALLHAIAAWGVECGANAAYLQVERDNDAARRLYERAGFRERYGYHYRTRGLP